MRKRDCRELSTKTEALWPRHDGRSLTCGLLHPGATPSRWPSRERLSSFAHMVPSLISLVASLDNPVSQSTRHLQSRARVFSSFLVVQVHLLSNASCQLQISSSKCQSRYRAQLFERNMSKEAQRFSQGSKERTPPRCSCHVDQSIIDEATLDRIIAAMKLGISFPDSSVIGEPSN